MINKGVIKQNWGNFFCRQNYKGAESSTIKLALHRAKDTTEWPLVSELQRHLSQNNYSKTNMYKNVIWDILSV